MTVSQAEAWCGMHHYGPQPFGWYMDDGYGNAIRTNLGALLYYLFSDGWDGS